MAIIKIHPIKATLNKAIAYITNPEKTDDEFLVSGYNVDSQFAQIEFEMTSALAKEINGDYTKTGGSNILAYHLIQSFAPFDKITPAQAHEIGKRLADELLGGKYEYVLSTHVDKGHIHNHVLINATSFYDYKKFETVPYKTVKRIRGISDKLCVEYGLYVINSPKGKGQSYEKWNKKDGTASWKSQLEVLINNAILESNDFTQFIKSLKESGVEIKEGKHISFCLRKQGQDRFTRGKTIGDEYTKEAILKRIADPDKSLKLIEQIKQNADKSLKKQSYESRQYSSLSYERHIEYASRKSWLADTKELANALLLIRREDIEQYSDFDDKINFLSSQIISIKEDMKAIDSKNLQYKEAAKYLLAYNKYSPIIQGLDNQSVFNKKGYEKKYSSEIMAFSHAETQLENMGINTNVDTDKVLSLIRDRDNMVEELFSSLKKIEHQIDEIRQAKIIINIITGDQDINYKQYKEPNMYL